MLCLEVARVDDFALSRRHTNSYLYDPYYPPFSLNLRSWGRASWPPWIRPTLRGIANLPHHTDDLTSVPATNRAQRGDREERRCHRPARTPDIPPFVYYAVCIGCSQGICTSCWHKEFQLQFTSYTRVNFKMFTIRKKGNPKRLRLSDLTTLPLLISLLSSSHIILFRQHLRPSGIGWCISLGAIRGISVSSGAPFITTKILNRRKQVFNNVIRFYREPAIKVWNFENMGEPRSCERFTSSVVNFIY